MLYHHANQHLQQPNLHKHQYHHHPPPLQLPPLSAHSLSTTQLILPQLQPTSRSPQKYFIILQVHYQPNAKTTKKSTTIHYRYPSKRANVSNKNKAMDKSTPRSPLRPELQQRQRRWRSTLKHTKSKQNFKRDQNPLSSNKHPKQKNTGLCRESHSRNYRRIERIHLLKTYHLRLPKPYFQEAPCQLSQQPTLSRPH